MGAALFKALVPRAQYIQRVFAKFKEVTPTNVSPSECAQLIVGSVAGLSDIIAPLSGKQCVYYKFTEEIAVPFDLVDQSSKTSPIYVDAAGKNGVINSHVGAVTEIHTGEDAFPALEFGDDLEATIDNGNVERIMLFEQAEGKIENKGIAKVGVPQSLKDLLLRHKFDLFLVPGTTKHKRMRFIETCIEPSGKKYYFIGVVKKYDSDTPLGQRKLKLDPVDSATNTSGLGGWDLLSWKEITKKGGIIVK